MQNVGTWNSDFAIFLFFVMMLPIFISMIANMFDSLSPPKYTTTPTTRRAAELANSHNTNSNRRDKVSNVSPNVVRLDNSSLEIIQAELKAIKNKLHSGVSHPKPKPRKRKKPRPKLRSERKPVPQKDRRRKPAINPKDKEIQQEASNALNTLGIKKSKANSIVKDLYKKKAYDSSEDLLKDAIVYIG